LRSPIALFAIIGVAATVGGLLLLHPAAEKPAVMATFVLNPSSLHSEGASLTLMPTPASTPRDEGLQTSAAARVAPAPDTTPTVAPPDPARLTEAVPIVAAAPAPDTTTPKVAPSDLELPTQAAPIAAPTSVAPAHGTVPTAAMIGPATPLPEPQASTLKSSVGEFSSLLTRGDSLLGVRDVTSARLYYERAADAGDAQAALRLGETYDPAFLALARLNEVRGDPVVAARWYRRARELGNPEAEILLKSLRAN
jgi:hypothetical protein